MKIKLTQEQMTHGAKVGSKRLIENIHIGRKDKAGIYSFDSHIAGALGEVAACVATGVDWRVVGETYIGGPDIPPDWEVRTMRKNYGTVRIKPKDKDDRKVMCVIGELGEYDVVGWCRATEAKQPEYWRKGRFPGF